MEESGVPPAGRREDDRGPEIPGSPRYSVTPDRTTSSPPEYRPVAPRPCEFVTVLRGAVGRKAIPQDGEGIRRGHRGSQPSGRLSELQARPPQGGGHPTPPDPAPHPTPQDRHAPLILGTPPPPPPPEHIHTHNSAHEKMSPLLGSPPGPPPVLPVPSPPTVSSQLIIMV